MVVAAGVSADIPQQPPRVTKYGTGHADVLNGTSRGDVIDARDGADVVRGLGGDDSLFGGSGGDRLDGGAGNDSMLGGSGSDTLIGGRGHDDLDGGSGRDVFFTRDGARDQVFCGSGDDSVYADARDVVAFNCEHVHVRPSP